MHGPLEQNSQRKDDYDYSRFSLAFRVDEIFIRLIINSIILCNLLQFGSRQDSNDRQSI
ncbi:hypothetical protein J15TS10_50350 [Paenibacillus woosongensis]|uniref:Uncharacterized protein n=1 Tax=Paenibacillus woosongensis TaxID=307580 RepID=A0ABQ4MZ69_9BACL|nr:hypothetical protein J15TS10_50350 [Paenibacillus woosongensis]